MHESRLRSWLVVVRAMVRSTLNEREWRVCNIPVPSFLESWNLDHRTRECTYTCRIANLAFVTETKFAKVRATPDLAERARHVFAVKFCIGEGGGRRKTDELSRFISRLSHSPLRSLSFYFRCDKHVGGQGAFLGL